MTSDRKNTDGKNIVLIVIDTLSAQHLQTYGYERETAPFLDELAENNTYFDFAYSTAPWTVPSHASIFSGQLPKDHGTHTQRKFFDADSFVEDLEEEGYTTIAFSNNDLVSEELGYDTGFQDFTNVTQAEMWENMGLETLKEVNQRDQEGEYSSTKEKYLDFLKLSAKQPDIKSVLGAGKYLIDSKRKGGRHKNFYRDKGAEVTNQKIKKRLKDQEDDFFLFINFMEPHHPFAPPLENAEKFLDKPEQAMLNHLEHYEEHSGDDYWWTETSEKMNEQFRGLYDAEINYIDSKIEQLYNWINSEFEDTVFYIVSDHGECVGDYGLHGHQCGIWEKTIRVPAIIAGPDVEDREVEQNFSLQNLGELIQGEKIENVVQEDIYAEYHGLNGLKNPEKYSKEEQKYLKNTSQTAINQREALVENTDLEDVTFTSHKNGRKDPEITQEKKLRQKIKQKFNDITEGLDF